MPGVDTYTVEEVRPVGARQKYRLMVNGYETMLNLTEAEQKKLYPEATLVASPAAPAAKQRTASNKARTASETK
jgi:hypothetical protein